MPKYGPQEINLAVVVIRMNATLKNLSASVEKMTSPVRADSSSDVKQTIQSVALDLHMQLGVFNDAIGARLDHLNAVCAQLVGSAAARNDVTTAPPVSPER